MKTINTYFKKFLIVTIIATSLVFVGQTPAAKADSITVPCTQLSYNLSLGDTDSDVVALQNFLATEGYFSYTSTGYFGPITFQAVRAFQATFGIPQTGTAGPITRARIQSMSCGNPVPNPTPYNNAVSIYSASPLVGPAGTMVTLYGTGFTNNNTIYFGNGAVSNVTSNGNTLTFAIPTSVGAYCPGNNVCPMYAILITPGTYNFYVANQNGTSNTMSFTVTSPISPTSGGPISISGVDAPNSLQVGILGNWTIHVTTNYSGNLHYSVVWGDEAYYANGNIMAPYPTSTQSFATFTHAYTRTGNFTPIFTVSDDYGHSTTTTVNVNVTPTYYY